MSSRHWVVIECCLQLRHGHRILSTNDRGKTTITYTPNAVTTYSTEEYNVQCFGPILISI